MNNKGTFKPGNPGKPKGSQNRITKDIRQSITDFLEGHFDEVVRTWGKLSDRDKVNFYRDLLQYSVPRLQSTELKTDFDRMTDEQLDIIINELKKTAYESIGKN